MDAQELHRMDAMTDPRLREPPAPVKPRSRLRGRLGMAVLFLLVIAGVGAALWYKPAPTEEAKGRGRNEAIPVLASPATISNVPIYLDGLGTVQAFQSVTVKPQVDGKLIEVRFTEGQDVKAGDVLAKIDPATFQATLDQALGKLAQDQANLANARVDLVRYQKLAATAYTSAQQSDTQKSLVAQLEAQVRQDQAQVDTARTQLGYTTLTAQIDGRTGIRQVDAGNIVHASDTTGVVVITTLKPISVVFTLPQQALPQVAKAMQAGKPEVLAMNQAAGPLGAGKPLDRGELTVLDNQVDPTTGTIKLKATFPNPDLKLWPGGFVGVRLHVDTAEGAITVPDAAVQRGPRGSFLYVIGADNTVTRRDVTIGHEDAQLAIVTTGLKDGEKVVTDGASRLNEGSKVRITDPPAANPNTSPMPTAAPGAERRRARPAG
jgi:multidrug efflux system membrane fusion protein